VTRAVVFGYGDVGIRCLATLLAQGVHVPLVVTHADDPNETLWYGSLARFASERDIPVHLSEDAAGADLAAKVALCAPDFLFSFYYRRMIPGTVLALASRGALNMHGSLLPQFRGRAPVNWVCVMGATETGASLHYMAEKPDAGNLVDQMAVPILPDDTAFDVFRKVCTAAELVLHRVLPRLIAGTAPNLVQDLKAGRYYGARRPQDGEINWAWNARRIHDLVRAVAPPFPAARTVIDGQAARVLRSLPVAIPSPAELAAPGLFAQQGRLFARCGDGSVLRILELELDGKGVAPEALAERLGAASLPLPARVAT
jgi:methionyl-tRNA formyltransferase